MLFGRDGRGSCNTPRGHWPRHWGSPAPVFRLARPPSVCCPRPWAAWTRTAARPSVLALISKQSGVFSDGHRAAEDCVSTTTQTSEHARIENAQVFHADLNFEELLGGERRESEGNTWNQWECRELNKGWGVLSGYKCVCGSAPHPEKTRKLESLTSNWVQRSRLEVRVWCLVVRACGAVGCPAVGRGTLSWKQPINQETCSFHLVCLAGWASDAMPLRCVWAQSVHWLNE